MKKSTKAALAAGAAGILLAGGAGTYALWSDSDVVDAGAVTTGHLRLDATGAGTWTDASGGGASTTFDPAEDTLVPGDVVTYAQTVTIDAEGKNLQGALGVGTLGAIPAALADQVTVGVEADATAAGLSEADGVITFAEAGQYQVPVTITVTFARGTEGSTPEGTMDQNLDLGELALTLNQVRP